MKVKVKPNYLNQEEIYENISGIKQGKTTLEIKCKKTDFNNGYPVDVEEVFKLALDYIEYYLVEGF